MGAGEGGADVVRGEVGRVQDIAAYGQSSQRFTRLARVAIPKMATREIGRGILWRRPTRGGSARNWWFDTRTRWRDTAQAIVLSVARAGRLPEHPRGTPGAFRGYRPRLWVGRYAGPEGSYVLVLVGDVVPIGGHAASGP